MKEAVQEHGRDEFREDVWDELAAGMRYVATDFADDGGEDAARGAAASSTRSAAPAATASTTSPSRRPRSRRSSRSSASAASAEGWTRLIVEKPFGHDLASAQRLNAPILPRTSPRRRSSGSTTTSARRRSRTCSRCGSRTGSSSRSGTASSSTTSRSPSPSRSGSRAAPAFYEQAGAIRDIFQNHLLQLVALTAMEPPIDFTADSVRNEKVKVLRALHTPGPEARRARPVRARLHRGRGGARLSRGGGRRARTR